MKLTKEQLKKLIKEAVVAEMGDPHDWLPSGQEDQPMDRQGMEETVKELDAILNVLYDVDLYYAEKLDELINKMKRDYQL